MLINLAAAAAALAAAYYYCASRRAGRYDSERERERIHFRTHYFFVDKWLYLRNCGFRLADHFEKIGVGKVAIHGLGELGMRAYEELSASNVRVEFFIDRSAEEAYRNADGVLIAGPKDWMNQVDVDAILVTPLMGQDEIAEELGRWKPGTKVSLLSEIVETAYMENRGRS